MNNYKEILSMVEDQNKEEVYTALMAKEKDVLDTINRMVEQKPVTNLSFVDQSLFDLVTNFALAWKRIYQEAVLYKQRDVMALFYNNERKIYVGVMLVVIALFLYFIDTSR
jgi:hypothetical protein